MEIVDIISQDARRHGKRPGAVLTGVSIAAANRKAKLLHQDKTVAILEPLDESGTNYMLHMFTADSLDGFLNSIRVLFDQVHELPGAQRLYASIKNKKLMSLAKDLGINIQPSDREGFNWMMEL